MNLRQFGYRAFDPFSGTGTIATVLHELGMTCHTNDINPAHTADYHGNALQPDLFRKVLRDRPANVLVTSPWYAVLDLALPLLAAFAGVAAFVHVPMHYVFDAHGRRATFLHRLQDQQRLAIIGGLPRGPTHRRCLWLCIFRDSATRLRATSHCESRQYHNERWAPIHLMNSEVNDAQPTAVRSCLKTTSSLNSAGGGKKGVVWTDDTEQVRKGKQQL